MTVRAGGKTEGLLRLLALRPNRTLSRGDLICLLWPQSSTTLAEQSLYSLVSNLRRLLSSSMKGAAPIVHENGGYRLNAEAGVGVDVSLFDELTESGVRKASDGDKEGAAEAFRRAIALYHGDLVGGTDANANIIIERERLRAVHLALLAHLADDYYKRGDTASCLDHALHLLSCDPCREDAHRIVMRCYTRQGQRAQAMRQFRICEQILRIEFDTAPETLTRALFEQIRLDSRDLSLA